MYNHNKIRKNEGNAVPHELLFFDVETYVPEPSYEWQPMEFRLGYAVYRRLNDDMTIRGEQTFNLSSKSDIYSAILSVLRSKIALYVFAHNAAFDVCATDLIRTMLADGWTAKPPVFDYGLFILKFRRGTNTVVFLDTMNWFKTSVSALGATLNLPKLSIDFNTSDDVSMLEYCKRDVEIIADVMIRYIKMVREQDYGNFAYTTAGQSLNAWRHRFMDIPIRLHDSEEAVMLERDAYHGGRVECFRLGDFTGQSLHCLDVNSMYPYVMRYSKLPIKLLRYYTDISPEQLKGLMSNYYVIADVSLDLHTACVPVVWSNKLIWPIGQFTAPLHSPELELAFKNGSVLSVSRAAVYTQGIVFASYVDNFMSLKVKAEQDGDTVSRSFYKLFLNSLYGKFGQIKVNETCLGDTDEGIIARQKVIDIDTGTHYEEITFGGKLYRRERRGETAHSSPAVAGAITSHARALLYEYIEKAGKDHCYYCDTDSLIVDSMGFRLLGDRIDSTILGRLKEEWVDTSVVINGLKDYSTSFKRVLKGVPLNSTPLTEGRFEFVTISSFTYNYDRGLAVMPAIKLMQRSRQSGYTKGEPQPTGDVSPIVLPVHPSEERIIVKESAAV